MIKNCLLATPGKGRRRKRAAVVVTERTHIPTHPPEAMAPANDRFARRTKTDSSERRRREREGKRKRERDNEIKRRERKRRPPFHIFPRNTIHCANMCDPFKLHFGQP
jgi:hypothetical protein